MELNTDMDAVTQVLRKITVLQSKIQSESE